MSTIESLVQRFEALKLQEATAQKLRTEAETLRRVAQQRVEAIDAEIRSHGVNPDNLEPELAALETELSAQVDDLSQRIAAEIAAYQTIIAAAKAAGLQG